MNQLREIKGFTGYFVSDSGDVYSKKSGKLIKLKSNINHKTGYTHVSLCLDGIVFHKNIHRLVAEAFIPNPENKPQVNHKNGIRHDNNIKNLEWVTRSENEKHKYIVLGRKGTAFGKFGKDNPLSKIVLQIKDNEIIAEFYGCHEADRATGISFKNINACCREKRNFAGGYQWKYK